MKMEYVFEVIRGWPYDGALDRNEVIKTGVTLSKGDWVEKQSDGTIDKTSSTATNVAGVVLQGNGDSGSAVSSGKALVLWSNFIGKVSNYDGTATYAPKSPLTVKSGALTLAGVGDPVIGHVLNVVGSSTTETAHLEILVK